MKKYTLLFATLFFAFGTFAQTFTLSPSSKTIEGASTSASIAGYITVQNLSGDSNFRWDMIENTLKTDWDFQFCDPATCFSKAQGIPAFHDFLVPSGKKKSFNFDVTPGGFGGTGRVRVAVYKVSDPTKIDTLTFNVNSYYTGIENVNKQTEFFIFPNPAKNEISISTNFNGNFTVEITNIIGSKMRTFNNVQSQNKLDISELPDGIYIMRISQNGHVVTKRFSKY